MLTRLEKSWPFISILLILVILASLFFWPAGVCPLGWIIVIAGLGMAVAFSVGRHRDAYRQGRIDRPAFVRNIVLDITGIILTILAAMFLARKTATYVSQVARRAAESAWPGTGTGMGILSGLLAAVLVGLGVGLLVRWVWGRLTRPKRSVSSAQRS